MSGDLTFRRVEVADLPLLHRWLNEPGVVQWWEGDDVSWDAVVKDYGPPPAGPGPRPDGTEHWLALLDGEPVGWIQSAVVDGDPEADPWFANGVPRSTGGIDYLVGEPSARGAGLGSRMIDAFVTQIVFPQHPEWTHVAADPQVANVASWRSLARAGFGHLADHDDELGRCRLMIRAR